MPAYILRFISLLFLTGYACLCFTQITLNTQTLTDQIVADLEAKISEAVYEKFKSVNNQVEQQVLTQWNFQYLLEDYKDLGIDPNDPQLVSRMGEALSQVYQRYEAFQEGNAPFTQEEVQSVFSQVWKPAATQVFGKESAEMLESSYNLMEQGRTRIQSLLEAAEKIHQEPGELPEAEIIGTLRTYGLEGDVLAWIEPLESLMRYGADRIQDPLEAATIIRGAMGSKQPVDKIQAMLSLGQKFGAKVPVIGELITPIFDLGAAVLDATLQLGQSLSQKLNQGCISDAGQFNVQMDPKVKGFLQAFPEVHRACPILDSRLTGASTPAIYTQTYYNEDRARDLFFYVSGAWKRGKSSPRHRGDQDIKGLMGFFRSKGYAAKVYDMPFMVEAYNQSPGFTNLEQELFQKSKTLGEKYRRIRSQLSLCEEAELNTFFLQELGFQQLFNLFLGDIKPEWRDLSTQFFWESTFPEQLLFLNYLGKIEYPQLQFARSSGYEKITLVSKLLENLEFEVVEIFGKVQRGSIPVAGVRMDFSKDAYIYNRYDTCTKLQTDGYGSFRFFYLKYIDRVENISLTASEPGGENQRKELRLESQAAYQVNFNFEALDEPEERVGEEPHCDSGYRWDEQTQTCVPNIQDMLQNAPCAHDPNGRAYWDNDTESVVCDCKTGYTWDETAHTCIPDQEVACNEEFERCRDIAHSTFEYSREACDCQCAQGYEWNEDKSACIEMEADEVRSLDCEAYNAVEVMNPDTGEPECQCKPGFEPNADGTTCVPVGPECQMDFASPKWNPVDEVYECHCDAGYQWNADYTACIPEAPDCSLWGPATAQWSTADQVWECVCDAGYYWDADRERCVKTPPDCDVYPNAILRYDKFEDEYFCECRTGYKWNRAKTACIKINTEANREAAQALGELLTTLSGITRNTRDNPPISPENQHRGQCNVTYRSGANTAEQYTIPIGNRGGVVDFSFQTFQAEDRIHIYQGGSKVFDSGCLGTNGWRSQQLQLNGIFGEVRIVVDPLCDPNDPNTRWEFRLGCPN